MGFVHRLATLFEKATGIRVRCEFGNAPWHVTKEVDSALYHLVQEGLINSFRHGRADEIGVIFWMTEETVGVRLRDNGRSADQIAEGIGLRGMRERIERVAGSFRATPVAGGFLLEAQIPTDGRLDGDKNQNPNR